MVTTEVAVEFDREIVWLVVIEVDTTFVDGEIWVGVTEEGAENEEGWFAVIAACAEFGGEEVSFAAAEDNDTKGDREEELFALAVVDGTKFDCDEV